MYHRILRSRGGTFRVYEIEGGKPVRDAQFFVRPRAGERFDMYDADDELICEDQRAATCERIANERSKLHD